MVATTVAPPRSRSATTAPAMEPGAAPVTTATSSAQVPGAGRRLRGRRRRRPPGRCAARGGRGPATSCACARAASSRPAKLRVRTASSPVQIRARSSRTEAQRSSSRTARLASKDGETLLGPVGAELGLDERHQLGVEVLVGCSATASSARPSRPSRWRAVVASTPSGPVIDAVISPSAAASTVAPSPPPAAGMPTVTPWADATCLDGVVDDRGQVGGVDVEAERAAARRGAVAQAERPARTARG